MESFAGRRGRRGQCAQADATELLLGFQQARRRSLGGDVRSDGRHVLTIGGNDAEMWNLESRRPVVRYSPHGAVASAAVSPDGKLVATGSWDHSAKIWDAATGHAIRKLEGGHTGYINSVEFSPDGKELLTASDDGTARLWDVASGKPTGVVFKGHTARILSATFSPDGNAGAHRQRRQDGSHLGSRDGQADRRAARGPRLGRAVRRSSRPTASESSPAARTRRPSSGTLETGNKLITLEGHTAAITSVAFSPDGSRAVTGSQDNTAKLWDSVRPAKKSCRCPATRRKSRP